MKSFNTLFPKLVAPDDRFHAPIPSLATKHFNNYIT